MGDRALCAWLARLPTELPGRDLRLGGDVGDDGCGAGSRIFPRCGTCPGACAAKGESFELKISYRPRHWGRSPTRWRVPSAEGLDGDVAGVFCPGGRRRYTAGLPPPARRWRIRTGCSSLPCTEISLARRGRTGLCCPSRQAQHLISFRRTWLESFDHHGRRDRGYRQRPGAPLAVDSAMDRVCRSLNVGPHQQGVGRPTAARDGRGACGAGRVVRLYPVRRTLPSAVRNMLSPKIICGAELSQNGGWTWRAMKVHDLLWLDCSSPRQPWESPRKSLPAGRLGALGRCGCAADRKPRAEMVSLIRCIQGWRGPWRSRRPAAAATRGWALCSLACAVERRGAGTGECERLRTVRSVAAARGRSGMRQTEANPFSS